MAKKWHSKSTNRVKGFKLTVDGDLERVGVNFMRKLTKSTASGAGFSLSPEEAEAMVAGLQRYLDGRELALKEQSK